jgi:hypothetical protein
MSRYQHLIDAMKEDEYLTMTIAKSELHAILIDLEFAIEARTQDVQPVLPLLASQPARVVTELVERSDELATSFQEELDKLSSRNYELRMENEGLRASRAVQPMSDEQRELLARDDCGITDWTDPVNHGATASMRAAFRRGTKAAEAYHDITQPKPERTCPHLMTTNTKVYFPSS